MKKREYKLIKKYPGSLDVGTVLYLDNNLYLYWGTSLNKEEVENNPEFFEEIIEKQYEILTLKGVDSLVYLKKNGLYGISNDISEVGSLTLGPLLQLSWKIQSIRRLSDNEVFSIGDKCVHGVITSFKLDSNGIPYNGGIGVCFHTEERTITEGLKNCKKAKPVLFVTEDGVDKYQGDKIYYHCNWKLWEYTITDGDIIPLPWFSSKEAAQDFILMNKPVLSIKDLLDLAKECNETFCVSSADPQYYQNDFEKVKELVKSRL